MPSGFRPPQSCGLVGKSVRFALTSVAELAPLIAAARAASAEPTAVGAYGCVLSDMHSARRQPSLPMPVAELPRGGTPAEVKSFVVSYSPPQPKPFRSTCSITESTASTASRLSAALAMNSAWAQLSLKGPARSMTLYSVMTILRLGGSAAPVASSPSAQLRRMKGRPMSASIPATLESISAMLSCSRLSLLQPVGPSPLCRAGMPG